MREIIVHRKQWERENRDQHAPDLEGINESVLLRDGDTGQIIAIQYVLTDEEDGETRRELMRYLRYGKVFANKKKAGKQSGMRLSGMMYESEVFGYTAPVKIRRRFATSASRINQRRPEIAALLDQTTKTLWEKLKELTPECSAEHERIIKDTILEDWWIAGAPYTSGIINNTAALPYHKDSRNVPDSWSMMLCLRKHVGGGGLHLPEYDVTFGIPDNSVTFFDGQSTWHGVTPLHFTRPDSCRFTLVWYAKMDIQGSVSREEEMKQAKYLATINEAGEARRREKPAG